MNIFNNFSTYTFQSFTDKDENPELVKKINQKILKLLQDEYKKNNIKEINFIDNNIQQTTLKDAFNQFIEYKINTDKLSTRSVEDYNTTYKFLLLFKNENDFIHSFNENFFKEIQSKILKFPNNLLSISRYKGKKYNEIMKDFENKEYKKLSNKYINKIFKNIRVMFEHFKYNNYIAENVVAFKTLKETTDNILNFDKEELESILSSDNIHFKNLSKILLYTGLRIAELASISKDDINLKDRYINITKSKTKSGIRVIPIHDEIFNEIEHYYNDTEAFLFEQDANVNKLKKFINSNIKKIAKNKSSHSFRKNFSIELYKHHNKNLITTIVIDRLLGHYTELLSFNTYNMNKMEFDTLKDAIKLIDYALYDRVAINNKINLNLNF